MKTLKIFIYCIVTAMMVAIIVSSLVYVGDGGKLMMFTQKTLACYTGNGVLVVLIYSVPISIGYMCIKAIIDLS